MSLRTLASAALIAALALPAAAAAADREVTLATEGEKATWTSPVKTGAVYGSPVDDRAPACSAVYSCDSTLVTIERYGDLVVDVVGKDQREQDTMRDIDVHVFVSNAYGHRGDLLAEGTTANSSESVSITDLPAGHYLVYVDWYLGYGDYDGTATLNAPSTPVEPGQEPAFTPAPETWPTVTPDRTQALQGETPFEWDGPPGGGLSDVQPVVGCRDHNCDYTLLSVAEAGVLTVQTTDDVPTLIDADIHVYDSDENGSIGPEVGTATNFTPDETAVVDVEPGHYLVMVAYSGAGTYSGTAKWAPPPPVEEEF